MFSVQFPDRTTEVQALGLLLGRFDGRIYPGGRHEVPEAALEVLTRAGVEFEVRGEVAE